MEKEGEKLHSASGDQDFQEHKLVTIVAEARQQRGRLGSAKGSVSRYIIIKMRETLA